jgi:hypothetical protein
MLENRDTMQKDRFGLGTNKSRLIARSRAYRYLPALRSTCVCKMQSILSTTSMYTLQCSYVLLRMKGLIPNRLAGSVRVKKMLYSHHVDEHSRSPSF